MSKDTSEDACEVWVSFPICGEWRLSRSSNVLAAKIWCPMTQYIEAWNLGTLWTGKGEVEKYAIEALRKGLFDYRHLDFEPKYQLLTTHFVDTGGKLQKKILNFT